MRPVADSLRPSKLLFWTLGLKLGEPQPHSSGTMDHKDQALIGMFQFIIIIIFASDENRWTAPSTKRNFWAPDYRNSKAPNRTLMKTHNTRLTSFLVTALQVRDVQFLILSLQNKLTLIQDIRYHWYKYDWYGTTDISNYWRDYYKKNNWFNQQILSAMILFKTCPTLTLYKKWFSHLLKYGP